jgi:exodeoxyribonuclease-3
VGDFNIAPADADVYNPAAWGEAILCSPAERKALLDLQKLGLHDAFRHFPEQPPKSYTWWDYRQGGFQRNHGLRIDHILVSDTLISGLQRCWIDSTPRAWERPSDHAPILIELDSI